VRLRRLRKCGAAAWLGLIALAIQTLLPIHLAFALAQPASAHSHAEHAAYLARHAAHQHDAPAPASHHHQLCPICVSAHAGASAIALPAEPPAAPLPSAANRLGAPESDTLALPAIAAAAYRSRAPPVIA
jgi:hypothetical protein